MVITSLVCAIALIVLLAVKTITLRKTFSKRVDALFSESGDIAEKIFTYDQLRGLPEPVQRYFRYVLKNNQPYINYARLTHEGQFKRSSKTNWMKINGIEYFTTKQPGFIWKGKTNMFTALDMYLNNRGRLFVWIVSIYNIVNAKGDKLNQGELLRWLGESVWFPTNLLPGEKLHWTAIDLHSAKLTFNHCGYSIFYFVRFNDAGEITKIETHRYMGKGNLEKWSGTLKNYQAMNGILVPTRMEATWELAKGDFTYARFIVKKIEYNNPTAF